MIIAILVVLGLCFGSFVSALVFRLHAQSKGSRQSIKSKVHKAQSNDLSIVHGRSMCPHCKHELAPKDLIPVLSWVWLRGKCRYCRKSIDDTPLPELALAVLFVGSYVFWPMDFDAHGIINFSVWIIMLTGFMALFIYDLKWMILPNRIIYPLMGLAALLAGYNLFVLGELADLWRLALSVVIAGGIFHVLFQVSGGRWIGGGDVKLGIIIGLLLADPLKAFLMLFVASLLGTALVLPALVLRRLKPTSRLPFGPFLLVATCFVMLFGVSIIDWYKDMAFLAVISL